MSTETKPDSIKSMRILYFSRSYTQHDHQFLAALAKSRHDVFFLELEGRLPKIEDRPIPEQIHLVNWAGGKGIFHWRDVPRLVMDLRRVVGEVKPDLIHAGPIQTCAFLAVLSSFRPVLAMSWGFDLMLDAEHNWWWRWATRYTLKHSTFFACDARVTRAKAVAFGMNPRRTVVFPWGVDLRFFKPNRSSEKWVIDQKNNQPFAEIIHGRSARGNDQVVVLCNRSWEARYGVDVLARAFVEAAKKNPELRLILLGGGSQAQSIREILASGGVLGRVLFGGQIPQTDLPRWYWVADLFVSPSHVDGSSVSLMEALACGLPTLVSDIPANKEWVREGANGWLFPDGNAGILAEKILAVIASRGKLARIRRNARKTAVERADWRANFPILLETYARTARLKEGN